PARRETTRRGRARGQRGKPTTPPAYAGAPPHARRGRNVRVFSPPFLRRGGGRRPPGWSWCSPLLRLPHHAHAARPHRDFRRPVAGLAALLPEEIADRETEQRARHGIGQPVLARGDPSGVGERGHSIQPRRVLLLG